MTRIQKLEMKRKSDYILTEDQFEILLEYTKNLSENVIQKLFNFLAKEKKSSKNRKEILDKIKEISPFLNIPEGYEIYILELYLLNFRKDGDYSSLTKDNFVDPRKSSPKRTTNVVADLYSRAMMPFQGSNLRGYWDKDNKGKEYYVVESYGWYPIYIFKDDKWYEVIERYSSSTGRQKVNVNPVSWSDDLLDSVYLLTKEEMEMLRRGVSHEQLMKNKAQNLKKSEDELISKRKSLVRNWGYNRPKISISYKITSIDTSSDKPIINVDIYDVSKREGLTAIKTPENYLKGELQGIDKEYVEESLSGELLNKFKKFVGPRFRYNEKLRDTHNLRFNFNHLKK